MKPAMLRGLFIGLAVGGACLSPVLADDVPRYRIHIYGPIASLKASCDDPCDIDRRRNAGELAGSVDSRGEVEQDLLDTEKRMRDASRGVECIGECYEGKTLSEVEFAPGRVLREGFRVRIRGGNAHFEFLSVVDTATGPATLIQHDEFRIDRPEIALKLHGHDVQVLTAMDESEREDIMVDRSD